MNKKIKDFDDEREAFIVDLENKLKMAKNNSKFYLSNENLAKILYENLDILDLKNIIEIIQKKYE